MKSVLGVALALSVHASASIAAELPGDRPCAVLLGGGGTVTGDAQVDGNWFKIDSAISEAAAARLAAKGYDVRPLIVDLRDEEGRFRALYAKLSETRCAKVVQVSHALKGANGRVDAFAIEIDVLRFQPGEGDARTASAVSDYRKSYDFQMTREAMETLSISELGEKAADGVVQAGVLPRP